MTVFTAVTVRVLRIIQDIPADGHNFITELLQLYMMDKSEKERVKELYGSSESVESFILTLGFKIGNTTKSKLKLGVVSELEDHEAYE